MKLIFFALTLSATVSLSAQIKAITENGEKVLLQSDGSWKYDRSTAKESISGAEELTEPDIRKANWGDSYSQVRSTENVSADEWFEDKQAGFDINGFETEVAGLKAGFVYYFTDDKLVGARYVIIENHSNNNDYLKDYHRLHDILSEKYGKKRIEEEWHDDTWKNHPSEKGYALWQGDITMNCKWETNQTQISHSISSRDFDIFHIVDYKSKEYGNLIDEGVNKSGINVL